ncbi:MAG: hypothetical protein R3C53_16205 [Pirellulaceae bacterium]
MDWSTYTINFTQEGKRRVRVIQLYLGVFAPASTSASLSVKTETTIRQHIAAFEHLSGVAAVLYDNMKVVVTRWEDGQPIYNTRFLSLATHGFRPWACQPERPETKGKVERPIQLRREKLINGRTFRTLEHI